ncbi:MAG: PAS domain-containing protein [Clostridiaceae bacterium]|nr:PAS domain-containing protein [Clostridiaceae bacterium]
MLRIFFQNMTLIVSVTFVHTKILEVTTKRRNDKYCWFCLATLTSGVLSMLIMLNPLKYEGLIFDLRSVPIFIVTYRLGWKSGVIAGIIPSLYRLYIGGTGTMPGIFILIVLPIVLAYTLSPYKKTQTPVIILDIKRISKAFILYSLLKQLLLWITLDLTFATWFIVTTLLTIFSTVTLILIVLMLNDANRSILFEKNLRTSEERYRRLLEVLPDAVLVYKEDEIVYSNTQAVKILRNDKSTSLKVLKVKDLAGLFNNYVDFKEKIEELKMNKAKTVLVKDTITLANGKNVDVEMRGTSFISEGERFIINVIRDLTSETRAIELSKEMKEEKKRLQEAIEYDNLKTGFFSNLSHEFKTPINLIFSTLQILELDIASYVQQDTLNIHKRMRILKQNCNRMIRLINNLIDVTKMDSGYFQLELQNCNIVNIVEDITLSVAEYTENKNISLVFDTDVEEKIIAVDPNAVERIMLNLLSNAVKFTEGHNEIAVNLYNKSDYIVIIVKDQGVGIPEDKLQIIFDRFRQVDKSLTRKHEGSGIGLSLVYTLVHLHKGEIEVKSQYGKGSEFIITLPSKALENDKKMTDVMEPQNQYIEKIHVEFSDIYSVKS